MNILIFIEHYFPGHKSGGPARTIINMVETLGAEFNFLIVTSDRDIGDLHPYDNIQINQWVKNGNAQVFYASPEMLSFRGFKEILSSTKFEVVYLNSFFNIKTTGKILVLRLLGLMDRVPVIIAPRGEFSAGALKIKAVRKNIFIWVVKKLKIYKNLIWQASSADEERDILYKISDSKKLTTFVAPDMTRKFDLAKVIYKGEIQADSPRKLVFVSRICRMKNLQYLLMLMSRVSGRIKLSIYGPVEDILYWGTCQDIIKNLPENIEVIYHGDVSPNSVPEIFSKHDVFFFPTLGENFGHVIYEALASGTCVVVSDKTPWIGDSSEAIEVIPLSDEFKWVLAIEKWLHMTKEDLNDKNRAAITYAHNYVNNSGSIQASRNMFYFAINNFSAIRF